MSKWIGSILIVGIVISVIFIAVGIHRESSEGEAPLPLDDLKRTVTSRTQQPETQGTNSIEPIDVPKAKEDSSPSIDLEYAGNEEETILQDSTRLVGERVREDRMRTEIKNPIIESLLPLSGAYADSPLYEESAEKLRKETETLYDPAIFTQTQLLTDEVYKLMDDFFRKGQFASPDAVHSIYLARSCVDRAMEEESNLDNVELMDLASQVYQAGLLRPLNEGMTNDAELAENMKKRFEHDLEAFIELREKTYNLLTKAPNSRRNKELLLEARYDLGLAYFCVNKVEESRMMAVQILDDPEIIQNTNLPTMLKKTLDKEQENYTPGFLPLYFPAAPTEASMKMEVKYMLRFPSFRGDTWLQSNLRCLYKNPPVSGK